MLLAYPLSLIYSLEKGPYQNQTYLQSRVFFKTRTLLSLTASDLTGPRGTRARNDPPHPISFQTSTCRWCAHKGAGAGPGDVDLPAA